MSSDTGITDHYTSGDLLGRLQAALRDDGADPDTPTIETLAPYDQFHGRGLEATQELASVLPIGAEHHVLDVGSGIGGPARYMAKTFGCKVTGIDLTAEFCDVAKHLTAAMGLEDRVSFQQANALSLPFEDATFDGVYSMNVSMNIEDKTNLYSELMRVLKKGGWLALSELAQGPGGTINYPTPWAKAAEASFLITPEETQSRLEQCGFLVMSVADTVAQTKAFGTKAREMVERGEKPPHRAISLIHGDVAEVASQNMMEGLRNQCVVPIEVFCFNS